jgi:hypothetical protein
MPVYKVRMGEHFSFLLFPVLFRHLISRHVSGAIQWYLAD